MKILFAIGSLVVISFISLAYAQTEKVLFESEEKVLFESDGIKVLGIGNDTVVSGNVTNGQLSISVNNGTVSYDICPIIGHKWCEEK